MFSPSLTSYGELSSKQQISLLARPKAENKQLSSKVGEILDAIHQSPVELRDTTIQSYTQLYDGISQNSSAIPLLSKPAAQDILRPYLEEIDRARDAIREFHIAQKREPYALDLHDGEVRCERLIRPLEKVGFYVPGGEAALFSSLMMMAIPAAIAGCSHMVLCTPPVSSKTISPLTHALASLLGIDEIHATGGAQAIAAMAFGSTSVTKVDKIFGPGNAWVNEAKLQVSSRFQSVGIDLPAGPSEVMVVADKTAKASFIAADLLAQAEHGPDTHLIAVFVTKDDDDVNKQEKEDVDAKLFGDTVHHLQTQLESLPKQHLIKASLSHSRFLKARSRNEAIHIINTYAPEHLILQLENPRSMLADIQHAGSIFLGHNTPESLGDYASGTNHILPTLGYAKQYSGLTLEAFEKTITLQEAHLQPNSPLANTVIKLAKAEGLQAHAQAMNLRLSAHSEKKHPKP